MSNLYAWNLSDLSKVKSNGKKVMSTFACGGGSSMGYKRAGYDVVAANDIDPEMAWHYKKNLDPKHYFLCPIHELLKKDLPEELYALDILDGSPPCSTFSVAGTREESWGKEKYFREGQAKQVLSDLFFDFLDLVEKLMPKVVIAENVKGMLIGNAKGYTKAVVQRLKDIGYHVQVFLIDAANCGVPQKRERVFFCAIQKNLLRTKLELNPSRDWVAAGDAIDDIEIPKDEKESLYFGGGVLQLWKATPQGKSLKEAHKKGNYFTWKKNSPTEPVSTLLGIHHSAMHWAEPRYFSESEFRRLASFPDDYVSKSPNVGKYIMGMSVPPKMMEFVASQVYDLWLRELG